MDVRLKELKRELRRLGFLPAGSESQAYARKRKIWKSQGLSREERAKRCQEWEMNHPWSQAPRYVTYGDRRKGGRRYKFGITFYKGEDLGKAKEVISRVVPEAVIWSENWRSASWVWRISE